LQFHRGIDGTVFLYINLRVNFIHKYMGCNCGKKRKVQVQRKKAPLTKEQKKKLLAKKKLAVAKLFL